MTNKPKTLLVSFLVLGVLLSSIVPFFNVRSPAAEPHALFLPLVTLNEWNAEPVLPPTGARQTSFLGFEAHDEFGVGKLDEPSVDWVRYNELLWSEIEPVPGERHWEVMTVMDEELRLLGSSGKNAILVVRSTPDWAQLYPGVLCGPVKPEAMQQFAEFMHDLVRRYSRAPFGVKYWELGNEPDVDPSLVRPSAQYGCWGDQTDPYYGGGYYAEMLKVVYPAIKRADPQAVVLLGGLLLNCNPELPGGCPDPASAQMARFLEGVLRNGGGDFFDVVSFHAYDGYWQELGKYSNSGFGTSWRTTGPVVTAKARFIRGVLERYGAAEKLLINTESAVMNYGDSCDINCELTKAYYVPQLYAATAAEGLVASIWYSLYSGWRHVTMHDLQGNPLPVYDAYLVAYRELREAQFVREVGGYPEVKVYEFERHGSKVWIVWALSEAALQLTIPGQVQSAWDPLGAPEAVNGSTVTVTLKPIYVEWR